MKDTGGMNLSEIESKAQLVLDTLTEMAEAIRPMVPEDFVREDPMLAAFNLIGGCRGDVRLGLSFFREAIRDAQRRKE